MTRVRRGRRYFRAACPRGAHGPRFRASQAGGGPYWIRCRVRRAETPGRVGLALPRWQAVRFTLPGRSSASLGFHFVAGCAFALAASVREPNRNGAHPGAIWRVAAPARASHRVRFYRRCARVRKGLLNFPPKSRIDGPRSPRACRIRCVAGQDCAAVRVDVDRRTAGAWQCRQVDGRRER
jgi:hypothetical protein